jgi:tetratricopeptide (TPR) repeat protein
MPRSPKIRIGPARFWTGVFLLSVLWWWYIGGDSTRRSALLASLSVASFVVGCVLGFLFTSYGEESTTIGKVRDWLIGGITGIALSQALEQGGSIKRTLLVFALGPGPNEFALAMSAAVTYTGLGFLFMFFQRELILNVLLAQSRAERGRLDGTNQAMFAIQQLLIQLPAEVLSGVSDIDEVTDKAEAERLRSLLYSPDVLKFLDQAELANRAGRTLDWDIVSKAAYIHHYRMYFEKASDKQKQARLANEWIKRALVLNPMHVDLTLKYVDVLEVDKQHTTSVSILKDLERRPDAPVLVKQWLGYYLLLLPNREEDAIKYSLLYLELMPGDSDALFNLACGYAQLYGRELKDKQLPEFPASENRSKALFYLKQALQLDPDYVEIVRTKWVAKGESFEFLRSDREFLALTELPSSSSKQDAQSAGTS